MKALLLKFGLTVEAFFLPFGAWGLWAVAFIDSAFLPLPSAIDFWVIRLSIRNPGSMLLYAAAATAGSFAGCVILYYVARVGGHAAAERKVGKERMARIRNWFERYEFLTVMVPAILPPPTPFKAFVITAGVTEVHLGKFLLALGLGRTIRYFAEAMLAVQYGPAVWSMMLQHGPLLFAFLLVSGLVAFLFYRVRSRRRLAESSAIAEPEQA